MEKVDPARVGDLTAAVVASLPELEQFMDWARPDRTSIEEFAGFIRTSLEEWESGASHNFHIIEIETDELVGNCGLMRRVGPGAIEIGYWIRSDRAGRGYATEAARLLLEAAWMLADVDRFEIRFDAANVASAAVAAKTGAVEIERRDVEIDNPGEIGIEVITGLPIPSPRPFVPSSHRLPERIDGGRFRLERLAPVHTEALISTIEASVTELAVFLGWARHAPTDQAVLDGVFAEAATGWDEGWWYGYLVYDQRTGEMVGGTNFQRNVGERGVEISYWTRSDLAGQGIATEVVRMMVEAAWALPDIDRIVLAHELVNAGSARVADKHGFVEVERRTIPILWDGLSGTVIWRELLRPADA